MNDERIFQTREFIPDEMKMLNNWVVWKKVEAKGRITKVPYSGNYRGKASSTNPDTWCSYNHAKYLYNTPAFGYDGIGFVFQKSTGMIFIDIDHCVVDGELDDRAKDILQAIGKTFVEVSQSGEGLHIIAKGTIPKCFKNPHNGVEMYDSARYCALTGNALFAENISLNQNGLDYVFERYKTPDRKIDNVISNIVISGSSFDDIEIIEKCLKNVKSGEVFRRLYEGDYTHDFPSRSEADLRFCSILAFWTNRDKDQIDSIFRNSGLMRDKWEREDYRSRTLELACAGCEECLSEFKGRKKHERGEEIEKTFSDLW